MNKLQFKLLLAMLALSATQMQAVRHTNKTQVSFRPQGVNQPMDQTLYHRLKRAHGKNSLHGKIQGSVFYQASQNSADLARLLLYNKANSVALTRVAPAAAPAASQVDLGYIFHSQVPAAAAVGAVPTLGEQDAAFSLKLAPERKSYGLHLGYEHSLWRLVKGLRFKVSAPVVSVEHHLNKIVTSLDTDTQKNVSLYFAGQYQVNPAPPGNNNQDFLKKALLVDQREVGVADVNVELNYKFARSSWFEAQVGLGATLPTGNRPDGTYAFQPVVGNNHHFGFGGQGNAKMDLLAHEEHELDLIASANYRYLVQSNEMRTLGIKGRNFGQYHLLRKVGDGANTMLRPAANELTLPVDVTPGHQFDLCATLAYSWRKVSFDAGYNFFFRGKENLRLRNAFVDNQYAIVSRDYNTTNADFAAANGALNQAHHGASIDGGWAAATATVAPAGVVNNANLDLRAASDEDNMSHAIFASLGLVMNEEATPVIAGIGGSYEFASSNNALEQWSVWAKAGISF
ncbi:hypothetical protein FJ365_03360 [Candidatus Dependentiae bacterium]|nr:hypothetical protein [Candidatus Dependentiae bacterium]